MFKQLAYLEFWRRSVHHVPPTSGEGDILFFCADPLASALASHFIVCTIALDFGELDLIFKVTAVEKLKIHSGGHLFSLKKLLLVLYRHVNLN